jgi:GAF domain-containing protein
VLRTITVERGARHVHLRISLLDATATLAPIDVSEGGSMSRTVDQSPTTDSQRRRQLRHEEERLLAFVTCAGSLEEGLLAVTGAVTRLCPALHACVLLADERNEYFAGCYSAHLPAAFIEAVRQLVLVEPASATADCGACPAESVACSSIATDRSWSRSWRWLCLEHGIRACHSEPVFGGGAHAVASLMLCLYEERVIDASERQVARIACAAAEVAIAQHRPHARS